MPKQGEIDYLKNIGPEGVWHAAHKPFSDADCGTYLISMGIIMNLLPPPPGRVLDLGCGTGWTSCLLAKRGYEVVGQDICPDMIHHARENGESMSLTNLEFVVGDYEELTLAADFDAAIFFDALHHSVDERAALSAVYRALKPNGVCITSEPGEGHAKAEHSKEAMKKFNVTERDMPPSTIIRAGKGIGFRRFEVFPHAHTVNHLHYSPGPRGKLRSLKALIKPFLRESSSIIRMTK